MHCFLRVLSCVVVTALKMLPLEYQSVAQFSVSLCMATYIPNLMVDKILTSSFCLVDSLSCDLDLCMWKPEVKTR